MSAFGFLACDQPRLEGNYGFKDQWLALEWVKGNIGAFGGEIDMIFCLISCCDDLYRECGRYSGHWALCRFGPKVHHEYARTADDYAQELTRYTSCYIMPPDYLTRNRPHSIPQFYNPMPSCKFINASTIATFQVLEVRIFYSTNPKTPTELRPQFHALCRALNLDPDGVDTLSALRDPSKISWKSITHLIETDALGTEYGTFRGCLDGSWLASSPDPMTWQRTGGFGKGLREHGIRSVILGDLTEEWYLYSIAHPILSPRDIAPNLERYYSEEIVKRMVGMYRTLPEDAESEQARRLFGEILSDAQVHLPVRLLVRDLQAAGFPTFRYEIRWTPEQSRPEGEWIPGVW